MIRLLAGIHGCIHLRPRLAPFSAWVIFKPCDTQVFGPANMRVSQICTLGLDGWDAYVVTAADLQIPVIRKGIIERLIDCSRIRNDAASAALSWQGSYRMASD